MLSFLLKFVFEDSLMEQKISVRPALYGNYGLTSQTIVAI